MRSFVLRRVLIAAPLLLGLLTVNFFLIHAAPGDPAGVLLDPDLDPEVREEIRKSWGLDRPLGEQYLRYLERVVLHFDLGYSIRKKRPVRDEILEALPRTLELSGLALLIQLLVGALVGILAAVRQNSRFDRVSRVVTLTFYSTPSFYLGLLLLFLFAGGIPALDFFPTSGAVDVFHHEGMGAARKILDRLHHLALPALTLGLGSAAVVARYLRAEMIEVLGQGYILAARARGLSERSVVGRHALRNALLPIVTIVGLSLPFLFSGSVIVENVFGWPGMGRVAVGAAFGRDYPLFLAVNLVFAVTVLLGNLLADLLYGIVDPRVRLR